MQPCMNWYCVYAVYALLCESIHVWMYNCMNECDLFDCINCRWSYDCIIAYDRWTRWNETKHVRWEAEWHRSTNTWQIFLGDDIIVNKSSRWGGKIRYKVATDVSWGWSPLLTQSLEEVAICRPPQSVPPLARLSSHAFCFIFLLFWKSLTFA